MDIIGRSLNRTDYRLSISSRSRQADVIEDTFIHHGPTSASDITLFTSLDYPRLIITADPAPSC